jgi:hypothetical protein
MKQTLFLIVGALLANSAVARVSVGACPKSHTPLAMPFRTGGTVADGTYHLMRFDKQFKWGWETFEKAAGETMDCKSANINKNANGFYWVQNKPLNAFAGWPKQVNCDSTTGKCDNVFPTPLEVIYYDASEPTFIMYSCLDLKTAAGVFLDTIKVPQFWKDLILFFQNWLGGLHYSNMIVAS